MVQGNEVYAFIKQITEGGSRSTVLRPIAWMMPICVVATLTAVKYSAPFWMIAMFAVFCVFTFLLYLFSYTYCLFVDKDALRSERYSIQKMAMEKGFVGDSIVGIIQPEASPVRAVLKLDTTSKLDGTK